MSMVMITVKQAAKILGKAKKTLIRWDKSRKFSPSRESPLKVRAYNESEVKNLKTLFHHKRRYRENLKRLREVQNALNPYSGKLWLTHGEEKLLKEEERLVKEHEVLFKNFKKFNSEIKRLYKRFFMKKMKGWRSKG